MSPEGAPSLSVVLATHNGERWIEAQIQSMIEQTVQPDEVIVVDDASEDRTIELVREAVRSWPVQVTVVPLASRGGSTLAFQRGIELASGAVIVLSDQDDIWLPRKLQRLASMMEERPAIGLAFSDAWLTDENGQEQRSRLWDVAGFTERQQRSMRHHAFGQILSRSIVSGCTLAFRSTFRPVILPFPVEIEDPLGPMTHDRWISIATSACAPVAVMSEPLIKYRIHADQQIGIPRLQVRKVVPSGVLRWRQLAVARASTQRRLQYYLDHLDELRVRVLTTGVGGGGAVELIDEARAHMRARHDLPTARWARLPGVLSEFTSGRYHRLSLGSASAVADLVR